MRTLRTSVRVRMVQVRLGRQGATLCTRSSGENETPCVEIKHVSVAVAREPKTSIFWTVCTWNVVTIHQNTYNIAYTPKHLHIPFHTLAHSIHSCTHVPMHRHTHPYNHATPRTLCIPYTRTSIRDRYSDKNNQCTSIL